MDQEYNYTIKACVQMFFKKSTYMILVILGSSDKPLLNTISKQLQEHNDRLMFLDAAKKHLEVISEICIGILITLHELWLYHVMFSLQLLYSEQWGLDHSLMYTLESCRGDMPLQLVIRDNPNLVYQVPKLNEKRHSTIQVLQAGTPNALLTYLFAK